MLETFWSMINIFKAAASSDSNLLKIVYSVLFIKCCCWSKSAQSMLPPIKHPFHPETHISPGFCRIKGSTPKSQERLKQCWRKVPTYLIGENYTFNVWSFWRWKRSHRRLLLWSKRRPTWAIFKAWKQRVSLLSTHKHLSWGCIRKKVYKQ